MVISQALPKSISIGKIYQLLECTNYDILRNLINIRGVRNRTKLRNIEKIEPKNQKPIKNQKNWFFFYVTTDRFDLVFGSKIENRTELI